MGENSLEETNVASEKPDITTAVAAAVATVTNITRCGEDNF